MGRKLESRFIYPLSQFVILACFSFEDVQMFCVINHKEENNIVFFLFFDWEREYRTKEITQAKKADYIGVGVDQGLVAVKLKLLVVW